MTQLAVKVAGTWSNVSNAVVKVSGNWKQVQNVKVRVAGTWQTVWDYFRAALPNIDLFDFAISTNNAQCSFYARANGQYQRWEGGSIIGTGQWKTGGGTGSDYEIKLTRTAGTSGGVDNTWLSLTEDRGWIWNENRDGNYQTTMDGYIEIRTAVGGTLLANATINVECVVEI